MKNYWIDPPGGWKYGFPLIKLGSDTRTNDEWLRDMGYPEEADYIRLWEASDEESTNPLNTSRPQRLSDGQLDSSGC